MGLVTQCLASLQFPGKLSCLWSGCGPWRQSASITHLPVGTRPSAPHPEVQRAAQQASSAWLAPCKILTAVFQETFVRGDGREVLSQTFESLSCHLGVGGGGGGGLPDACDPPVSLQGLAWRWSGSVLWTLRGLWTASRGCGIKTLALGVSTCPPKVRKCRLAL